MKKDKKAFLLFSTLILIFIFSILSIKIFENKSISSENILNQYNYIQAKNHLKFLEEYVLSIKSLDLIDKIQIKNSKFDIIALIEKKDGDFEVELIVKAKNENIRVYKRVIV
ncbi:hypothetical protein [Halarcobacter sp.]|uniref:hypothetical protein n=1 Tax=Halarcobacter sp. TaxID=2321133 RepID=UPI0029F5A6E7|nr:hypothetical protein [Halarcobacter sp.]